MATPLLCAGVRGGRGGGGKGEGREGEEGGEGREGGRGGRGRKGGRERRGGETNLYCVTWWTGLAQCPPAVLVAIGMRPC